MAVNDYEFTKSHTQIAKGVAIILMMVHHLFKFPERLHEVYYISIIPFCHPTIEFALGDFSKICVGMYVFLSGYGLYLTYIEKQKFKFKDSIKKILNLLVNYWVIFAIFIPIGLIFFSSNHQYEWSLSEFMKNLFILSFSYNGEWWFLRLYIELLVLFPIVKYIIRINAAFSFILSIFLYGTFICLSKMLNLFPSVYFIKNSFIYAEIGNILFWEVIFITGCIVAKCNLFKVANQYLSYKKQDINKVYFYGIFCVVVIRLATNVIGHFVGKGSAIYIDFILVPLFILACTNIIYQSKSRNIFLVFGKHSTNIWLTHTFFIYYYFQRVVFFPKLSILVFIWLSILTIISSIIINNIILWIYRFMRWIGKNFHTKEKDIVEC